MHIEKLSLITSAEILAAALAVLNNALFVSANTLQRVSASLMVCLICTCAFFI